MRSRGDGKSGQTGARDRIQFDTLLEFCFFLLMLYSRPVPSPDPAAPRPPSWRRSNDDGRTYVLRRDERPRHSAKGLPVCAVSDRWSGSRSWTRRGRGRAVASSGDNAFVLRGRGRPARLVGAYSVATPAAGRTTVHEGPRDPYDYRTTSVYPNAKQDAYYREFVSHLSQPICPCAPGRETESTPHRSRHTVRRPRDV